MHLDLCYFQPDRVVAVMLFMQETCSFRNRNGTLTELYIDGETSCLTLGDVVKLKAEDPEAAEQIARLLPAFDGKASGNAREDAREVGNKISELVARLGLRQNLTEKAVSKDQVPIIVGRATGGMTEGPVYEAVTRLVEGLY